MIMSSMMRKTIIRDERIRIRVSLICRMFFDGNLLPLFPEHFRKIRISFDLRMHSRQFQAMRRRERQAIHLRATDDECFICPGDGSSFDRIVNRRYDIATRSAVMMFRRPGNGRSAMGSDSYVLRPMITGWSMVNALKCFMSLGSFHGNVPSRPMTLLSDSAAMRVMRIQRE